MQLKTSVGVVLLAVAVGVAGFLLWSRDGGTAQVDLLTEMTANGEPGVILEASSSGEQRSAEQAPRDEPAQAGKSPEDSALDDGLRMLQPETLRLSIESTLVGQVDPGAFLDTALALSKLEISKSPIPEPDVSGAMRYPLLGVPEGVTAELWVARATTGNFTSPLLTYHVAVNTTNDYVFEGAARNGLVAKICLWTDRQGQVSNYGVLTESMVSGRSRKMGLDWMGRTVPIGVLFSYNPAHPYEWTATTSVLKDGISEDLPDPAVVRGQWPRLDDIEALKSGLLKQYGTL